MRVKLQLVICHDDDHEETVTDVITLNKNNPHSSVFSGAEAQVYTGSRPR